MFKGDTVYCIDRYNKSSHGTGVVTGEYELPGYMWELLWEIELLKKLKNGKKMCKKFTKKCIVPCRMVLVEKIIK